MTYEKTYGIYKNCQGKYAVATEISEDKKNYHLHNNLSYVKPEVALIKSESFIKLCYKDFINFQNTPIHFEFKNMGLIN
jgi:hypothetical protein